MKKPKKTDLHLEELQDKVAKAIKEMSNDKHSNISIDKYQKAVENLSNYQQKLKAEKPTNAKMPCINEYKIIK